MNFDIFIIFIRFSIIELVGIESNIANKFVQIISRTSDHTNPPPPIKRFSIKRFHFIEVSHLNLVLDHLSYYRLALFSEMGVVMRNVNIRGPGYPLIF